MASPPGARLARACAAALVGIGLATTAPGAQTPGGAVAERDLERVREERGRADLEVEEIRSRVRDLSSGVRQLGREVDGSSTDLRHLEVQLDQRADEINRNARELLVTRHRLAARRATLNQRLRSIYKQGPVHTVQVLLGASSFSDLIHRYKYLVLLGRHDRDLVRGIAALERQLVHQERLLERAVSSLIDEQSERSAVRDAVARVLADQERELTLAAQRERAAAARAAQLERDEQRIRQLIATLAGASSSTEPTAETLSAPTGGAGLESLEAIAAPGWPLQGRLLYGFGRAAQGNGTAIRWNGIGIAAEAGSPVLAAAAGTVVMAGVFDGYGPTVVLSHGGGYYSLYLYLGQIRVREGETVNATQVVGTVGNSEAPEGPHIEFQIRGPAGEAVDPLLWLRERQAR